MTELKFSKNTDKNLIHVRLEPAEAIESKKYLLLSEENLLEALKSANKYYSLRKEESRLKLKLSKKIKEISIAIRKLENNFPKMTRTRVAENKEKTTHKETHKRDLEAELNEIREKLRAIGR